MTDSDFIFIKPVESLQNVQSLTPAQQREERKRRQKTPEQPQQEPGEKPKETPPEQAPELADDRHQIDYRA
jgi:hypothetical protein